MMLIGCKSHPRYMGVTKPRGSCSICWEIWELVSRISAVKWIRWENN